MRQLQITNLMIENLKIVHIQDKKFKTFNKKVYILNKDLHILSKSNLNFPRHYRQRKTNTHYKTQKTTQQ